MCLFSQKAKIWKYVFLFIEKQDGSQCALKFAYIS